MSTFFRSPAILAWLADAWVLSPFFKVVTWPTASYDGLSVSSLVPTGISSNWVTVCNPLGNFLTLQTVRRSSDVAISHR